MMERSSSTLFFSKALANLAARWYLKRPDLVEKIQERYQSIWPICSVFLNLAFYHLRSLRAYKVTGINLEPTNVCNLHCSICPYDKEMTRGKGYMKLELVRKLLRENPLVESYTIAFLGEPFLHKGLLEMVELIKRAGKRVYLYTNGTLMKDDVLAALYAAGLDSLNFSMEGVDEAYTAIRGFPYSRLEANIQRAISLRDAMKVPTKIKIHTTVSEETRRNMKELVRRWNGVVDSIVFNPYQYTVPDNGQRGGCREVWRGALVVLWDGRVILPCCFDINASMCIGNAYEESLNQMWNGKRIRELREKILHEPREGVCRRCASYPMDGFLREKV